MMSAPLLRKRCVRSAYTLCASPLMHRQRLPTLPIPALLALAAAVPHLDESSVLSLIGEVNVQAFSRSAAYCLAIHPPLLRWGTVAVPNLDAPPVLVLLVERNIEALAVRCHQRLVPKNPGLLVFAVAVPDLHPAAILPPIEGVNIKAFACGAIEPNRMDNAPRMLARIRARAAG